MIQFVKQDWLNSLLVSTYTSSKWMWLQVCACTWRASTHLS